MKRIFMVMTCAMAVVSLFAQALPQKVEGRPEHRNSDMYKIQVGAKQQLSQEADKVTMPINNRRAAAELTDISKKALKRFSSVAYQAPEAGATKAFYWKPEGTYFLGVSRKGDYAYRGIIGVWVDEDVPAWVFQGRSENYTSLLYKTYISHRLPDNYFTDPVTGNWHDTLVTNVRGSVQTTYSYDMPLLTVEGAQKDTFVLNSPHKSAAMLELERNYMPPLTLAGAECPYPRHEDFMWPMTNAMTVDCNAGELVLSKPYSVEPLQYFMGTTDVTVDDNGTSKTIVPDGILVAYEKPQSLLYVKDITLQLEAYGVTAGKVTNEKPFMADTDTLWLTVENQMGAKIAESYATKANLTPVVVDRDTVSAMLQFNFLSDTTIYGEQLSVGFNVKEAFKVRITGMSKCAGDFSVVVANAPYGTNTYVVTKTAELVQYADVEPLLMLNGLYPTMLDAYTDVKDTLVLSKIEMADGEFKNVAIYSEYADMYDLVPAVYSYCYPLDTLKQVSNWVYKAPDWLTWGFSDADWDGEEYSDIITVYFFAEDLPEGQEFRDGTVTISFCGRAKSYYVYQGKKPADQGVGGMTDLSNSLAQEVKVSAFNNAFALTYPEEFNQVEIYTVSGAKVSTHQLPMEGTMMIDNTNLTNGMYIFRFVGTTSAVVRAMK